VRGECAALLGKAQTPAVGDEQSDAGLLLELCELLRDRRWTERQRLGDGGKGASQGELMKQPQSPQLQHEHPIDKTERYSS
jgi:hypothetical protein